MYIYAYIIFDIYTPSPSKNLSFISPSSPPRNFFCCSYIRVMAGELSTIQIKSAYIQSSP